MSWVYNKDKDSGSVIGHWWCLWVQSPLWERCFFLLPVVFFFLTLCFLLLQYFKGKKYISRFIGCCAGKSVRQFFLLILKQIAKYHVFWNINCQLICKLFCQVHFDCSGSMRSLFTVPKVVHLLPSTSIHY